MTSLINGMLRRAARGAVSLATAVALLALPVAPLAPLTIRPAKADIGQCLSSVVDYVKTGVDVAKNVGGLTECVANAASGGGAAVEAAVAAVLTGVAIANNGFPGSGSSNADRCNSMIDTVLAKAVASALADLYKTSAKGALEDVFGADTMKQLINALSTGATSELDAMLSSSGPLAPLTSYIGCGCAVVGGTMDVGKDLAQVGQDVEACAAILADAIGAVLDVVASGVEAVGEALEDFGHDVGCLFSDCSNPPKTWEQCVAQYVGLYQGLERLPAAEAQQLAQSTCASQGYEHVGTSAVPDVAGFPLCTAGWHVDLPMTIIGPDHQPHAVMRPACSCPADDTYTHNTGSQTKCACKDPTKGYNGKEDASGSSCSTCPAGTDYVHWAPADNGTCQAWGCPTSVANVPDSAKRTPGTTFGECTYSAGCDAGSVDVNGSCQMCGANQHAMYAPPLTINISTGDVISKVYPNGPPVGGKCYSCPAGSRSDPGSTSCTAFQCTLTEQLSPDGYSCLKCQGKVRHYLDADVCESSDGTPLYQPAMQCGSGTALIIDGKNYGGMVYNADDCSPLQCKGLDHPDYDKGGNKCVACKSVMHVPLSAFGLGSSGGGDFMAVILPDGSAGVKAGGKTYGFTEIQGQAGKLKMTEAGGSVKVVSTAKSSSSNTVDICLDGAFGGKPTVYRPIPGLTVYQVPPKMETTKTGLQILIPAFPGGGGSGNPDPIAPNLNQIGRQNQQTQTPMSTKQGPGAIPPPGGGASTVPAQGGGGSAASLPAHGDVTLRPRGKGKPDDSGSYTTVTVPAHGGDVTLRPRGKGKSNESGGYHTVTVKAHGDDPSDGKKTGTRPGRTGKKPKQDDEGGYKAVPVQAHGDDSGGSTAKPSLGTTPTLRTAPTFQRTTPSFGTTTRTLPSFSSPSTTPSGSSAPPKIH